MVETIELEIDDSMRAMRFDVESRTLALRTVPPVPEIGHDEVLVRVEAAGVCLSDVHIAQGLIKPRHIRTGEVTLGHEVAGTVARIGEGVAGWTVGDRVALQPLVLRSDGPRTLGVDYDGGWAEYVVTPASTLVAIPPTGLAFEEAAIIPMPSPLRGARFAPQAKCERGESVGVWGCGRTRCPCHPTFATGRCCTIVAVDPLLVARDRALALGADAALDPTAADFLAQLKDATRGGRMLDLALDFAGVSAAQQQTLSSLAYGGRIVLVGLSGRPITIENSVDFSVFKHTVRGHFGQDYSDVPPELIDLVSWGSPRSVGLDQRRSTARGSRRRDPPTRREDR